MNNNNCCVHTVRQERMTSIYSSTLQEYFRQHARRVCVCVFGQNKKKEKRKTGTHSRLYYNMWRRRLIRGRRRRRPEMPTVKLGTVIYTLRLSVEIAGERRRRRTDTVVPVSRPSPVGGRTANDMRAPEPGYSRSDPPGTLQNPSVPPRRDERSHYKTRGETVVVFSGARETREIPILIATTRRIETAVTVAAAAAAAECVARDVPSDYCPRAERDPR